jgi:hypothetical protein
MLGDADMDRPLGRIELGAGLEQIERRADRYRAQGLPGGLVVSALQPGPEARCREKSGAECSVVMENNYNAFVAPMVTSAVTPAVTAR